MFTRRSRITRTIHRTMPAVVSIVISKHFDALKKEYDNEQKKAKTKTCPTDFYIPPDKIDANGMVQIGGGSGFIADKKGIIITNKHVISELDAQYAVIMSTGERYEATIEARDPVRDIAILSIRTKKSLPTLPLGCSDYIDLGQTVLAFGNALGIFQNTVSQGIISGLSRSVQAQSDPDSPTQELRGLIQTDAAINPGNSGGPLVDEWGRVIGINVAVVSGAHNISFAIPINSAKKDLEDLKECGRIKRPLLGVRFLTINSDIQAKLKLSVSYGAFVTKEQASDYAVAPNSPAAQAKVKENDIILEWNGKKITEQKTIQDFLDRSSPGDMVTLTILRGKKTIQTNLILSERK